MVLIDKNKNVTNILSSLQYDILVMTRKIKKINCSAYREITDKFFFKIEELTKNY